MNLPSNNYKPRFKYRNDSGIFPKNLFFGFETEMGLWNGDLVPIEQKVKDLIEYSEKFYYIKYDGSIYETHSGSTGCEINSHPFNWNYLLNHLDYIKELSKLKYIFGNGRAEYNNSTAAQFRINRSCGFHIHISRDFFNENSIFNITKFIYSNVDFIEKISLRKNTHNLKRFANTEIKCSIEDFIRNSLSYEFDQKFRYMALNLTSMKTIELRFFQGTLNENLILAYLEFALAVSLFSVNYEKDNMTDKNFYKFIKENKKYYNDLIDLCDGRLVWQ